MHTHTHNESLTWSPARGVVMLFHSLQGSLFRVRLATENTRSSIILLRGEERGNGEISSGNRKARRKGNGGGRTNGRGEAKRKERSGERATGGNSN